MIQYPKLIYRSENKTCCTVQNEDQERCLIGYFKDGYDWKCNPYSEIGLEEAMSIHKEAKAEIEKPKEDKQDKEPEKDISKLSWGELKSYAKEVKEAYGVKLPSTAKRAEIEELINEVIDGGHSNGHSREGISES